MTAASTTDSTAVAERPRDEKGRFRKVRTGGAPVGNGNAVRHGLLAGKLPKGASYIERESDRLRTALEDAVVERTGGEISLYDAAVIQSAIRWERHSLLAQRWLRLECESMDAATRLSYSRDIARASAERDKCLKTLGLDAQAGSDPWAILDSLSSAGRDIAVQHDAEVSDLGHDGSAVDDRGHSAADATDDGEIAP